ncbi:DUF3885 domain-containing protein [Cytobacillus dafuensis]|uniref:DUF3885 domain-containing protein n=1 Tax=Cytobacillus dafuensis TaxID=1742359 RepID=UPI000A691AB1|nr:hypothetical protein [Cytobacillus dafuensis]
MKLKEIMGKHFDGLSITPDFYHQWKIGIHLELGNDIYQIGDNNRLNMERFNTIYEQVSAIVSILFKKMDDVLVGVVPALLSLPAKWMDIIGNYKCDSSQSKIT